MALKDLLVQLDQTERAPLRLQLAVDLAARHGSHLTALYLLEWSQDQITRRKTAELGRRSFSEVEQLDNSLEAQMRSAADELRTRLERMAREHHIDFEWQAIDGAPYARLPQHARYADLCLLGQDAPSDSASMGYDFAEEMLLVTGRPIILIPATGAFATLGRHVLVAWNSSRAAAMSLNAALPLIERAEQVTVISVNPSHYIESYEALPAQHLIAHLQRHGQRPAAISLDDVPDGAIASALQSKAVELGADLLVAGAYGHPRLREKLFGGVTNDLLASMRLPLMMAH